MSQSKAKLIVIALAFVVLLMSSLACEEMDEVASGYKNHKPTPKYENPWDEKDGVTFILSGKPSVQVAVFANGEVAAVLSVGEAREFSLSDFEDYMITIRTRSGDEAWETRQTLRTIEVGETIIVTADGLNISVR